MRLLSVKDPRHHALTNDAHPQIFYQHRRQRVQPRNVKTVQDSHTVSVAGCRLLGRGVSLYDFERIKSGVNCAGEEDVVVKVDMRPSRLVGVHRLDVSVKDSLHSLECRIAKVTQHLVSQPCPINPLSECLHRHLPRGLQFLVPIPQSAAPDVHAIIRRQLLLGAANVPGVQLAVIPRRLPRPDHVPRLRRRERYQPRRSDGEQIETRHERRRRGRRHRHARVRRHPPGASGRCRGS